MRTEEPGLLCRPLVFHCLQPVAAVSAQSTSAKYKSGIRYPRYIYPAPRPLLACSFLQLVLMDQLTRNLDWELKNYDRT